MCSVELIKRIYPSTCDSGVRGVDCLLFIEIIRINDLILGNG